MPQGLPRLGAMRVLPRGVRAARAARRRGGALAAARPVRREPAVRARAGDAAPVPLRSAHALLPDPHVRLHRALRARVLPLHYNSHRHYGPLRHRFRRLYTPGIHLLVLVQ